MLRPTSLIRSCDLPRSSVSQKPNPGNQVINRSSRRLSRSRVSTSVLSEKFLLLTLIDGSLSSFDLV